MIEIKAKDLKQGEEFIYSGREFIALGCEQSGILAVSKQTIGEIPFDKSNSNDWRKSSLRKYLNGNFLKKELGHSGLMKFTSDLMANDGMTDYGISVDFVFLLSADLYRKYRYQMPKWDTWVWLITPWSCLQDYGYCVSLVDTWSSLDYSCADDNIEVAVACLINPEFSVICTSSHSNDSETRMTNLEKIKQKINEMDEADVAKWIYDSLPVWYDFTLKCTFCTEQFHDCDNECEQHIQKWLKQKEDEDAEIH